MELKEPGLWEKTLKYHGEHANTERPWRDGGDGSSANHHADLKSL